MKTLNVAASVVMGVLLGMVVIGCQSDSPVNVQTDSGIQSEPVIVNTELDGSGPTPIALPRAGTKKPVVSRSVTVTPSQGGSVDAVLEYTSASTGKTVKVHAYLYVPAGAVNGNKTITMTMDTSVVGVQYAPKGLKFTGWSFLLLEAYNLDPIPSGSQIGFYYFNDNGGSEPRTWSSMTTTSTSIKMIGGTVPHFSRYAFGR
ncbi:MAG: hypothetical protein HW412_999 [Bacteroidetes bacterium]|nr:hypothetical protein [Bacteroidota bacterium]